MRKQEEMEPSDNLKKQQRSSLLLIVVLLALSVFLFPFCPVRISRIVPDAMVHSIAFFTPAAYIQYRIDDIVGISNSHAYESPHTWIFSDILLEWEYSATGLYSYREQ